MKTPLAVGPRWIESPLTGLSDLYFRPRAAEFDGKLYEWLGVVCFKRFLMSLARVDPNNPAANAYVLGGKRLEDVLAFERRTRRSELIHLAGLAASTVLLLLAAWLGALAIGAAGAIVFAANFHCFILQRYNRIRILRVLDHRPVSANAPSRDRQPCGGDAP